MTDRIRLRWHSEDPRIGGALEAFADYVAAEVLAVSLERSPVPQPTVMDVDGAALTIDMAVAAEG